MRASHVISGRNGMSAMWDQRRGEECGPEVKGLGPSAGARPDRQPSELTSAPSTILFGFPGHGHDFHDQAVAALTDETHYLLVPHLHDVDSIHLGQISS